MIHSLFDDDSAQSSETSEPDTDKKKGFFRRLVTGLSKTRKNLNEGFDRLVGSHTKLDDEFMEQLEEILFSADVGVDITMRIVSDLKADVKKNLLKDTSEVIGFIKKELVEILNRDMEVEKPVSTDKPFVILVIGVNGSGKTTTVGKISAKLNAKGHSVLLAAGDTFRAAAIDQLEEWARRSNADLVRHQAGSDPSAVVFDAYEAAVSRGRDVMIADTAGRLHSKVNLMEELKKIKRIIGRQAEGAPHETLLVLDATTGQNAINQAKMFHSAIGITGIVLTKLDGTAKGGVVINIMDSLKLPVRLIGVGEGVDDLRPFRPDEFIDAIFEGESPADKTQ
ncbi:Signal recognition particle receptor FtsY [hydrothermal vent metagenome]|uniref:Signal recognition particle receptor FtsY n=1 Tax=hydrothermal vent metagenome TaxID=652676 RepID=A0A3B1CMG5_9ZZZZ